MYEQGFNPNVVNAQQGAYLQKPAPVPSSVGAQFDTSLKRIFEIGQRLSSVADAIYGSVPTAADAPTPPRPVSSFASRVSDLDKVVNDIEQIVSRIQSGL